MGQEESNLIDESVPTQTLRDRSIEAVAQLIRSNASCNIVAMTGAGISTAVGIPDFRSPGTGLYANLQRLNLPYAEAVFSIDYFRQNPKPFYVLAQELYPGRFHPSVSHAFLALLAQKSLLRMLFTQNIDCLERAAGVPPDRIVEAHGSFATQRCIDCGTPFPDDAMREHVRDARVARCGRPGCGGLVKPDIVFFGESLPPRFHQLRHVAAADADLVLVMGTSLTVYPFAGLPALAADGVPRVLFNRERVGDLGTRPDDVLVLGSCDAGVRQLAAALGWADELEAFWRGIVGDAEADRQRIQDGLLARGGEEEKPAVAPAVPAVPELKVEPPEETTPAAVVAPLIQPLPVAETEVNEIAKEIEAVLKLDSGTGTPAAEAVTAADGPVVATKEASPAAKAAVAAATTTTTTTATTPSLLDGEAADKPTTTTTTATAAASNTPLPPPAPAPEAKAPDPAPATTATPDAAAPKENKPQE